MTNRADGRKTGQTEPDNNGKLKGEIKMNEKNNIKTCAAFLENAMADSMYDRSDDYEGRFVIEVFRDRGDDDFDPEVVRGWTLARKDCKPHVGQVWDAFNSHMESAWDLDYYSCEMYGKLTQWLGEMSLAGIETDAATFDFGDWWSDNVEFSLPSDEFLSATYAVYWKEAVTVGKFLEMRGLSFAGYAQAKEIYEKHGGDIGNPVYKFLYDNDPEPNESGWDGLTEDYKMDVAGQMELRDICNMYDAYIAEKPYKVRFNGETAVGFDADSDWGEMGESLGKSMTLTFTKNEWDIMTGNNAQDYDGSAELVTENN